MGLEQGSPARSAARGGHPRTTGFVLAIAWFLASGAAVAEPFGRLSEPSGAVAFLLDRGTPLHPPSVSRAPAWSWDGSVGKASVRALYLFYRNVFATQDLPACNFNPSCSRFSERAVNSCSFVEGVLISADRLMRDHPLASGLYPLDRTSGLLADPPERYCLTRQSR